jgi:hypothetical protein
MVRTYTGRAALIPAIMMVRTLRCSSRAAYKSQTPRSPAVRRRPVIRHAPASADAQKVDLPRIDRRLRRRCRRAPRGRGERMKRWDQNSDGQISTPSEACATRRDAMVKPRHQRRWRVSDEGVRRCAWNARPADRCLTATVTARSPMRAHRHVRRREQSRAVRRDGDSKVTPDGSPVRRFRGDASRPTPTAWHDQHRRAQQPQASAASGAGSRPA